MKIWTEWSNSQEINEGKQEDTLRCDSLVSAIVCLFVLIIYLPGRASGSTQGGQMALSVVYFLIMHHLGRPHYVWDEYLYSVL